jgi:hypothetical protein
MHQPKLNNKTKKMTKGNLPIYSEERYQLEMQYRKEKREKAVLDRATQKQKAEEEESKQLQSKNVHKNKKLNLSKFAEKLSERTTDWQRKRALRMAVPVENQR